MAAAGERVSSHEHHEHGHHHHHHSNEKTLLIALALAGAFMLMEVVGGWLTHSLALLSDAGHMFSDSLSLLVSYLALRFAKRKPDARRTFGYRRFEILAAAVNGVTLLAVSVWIMVEAVIRLKTPAPVQSVGMLWIAAAGLAVNIAQAKMLHGSHAENLNMKSAYLHVLSDLLGSVAAIAAAVLIMAFGWTWADPVVSLLVSVLILRSGWQVSKSAWQVLMEGVPDGVSLDEAAAVIASVTGVRSVHDLHIWSLSSDCHALSCHVVTENPDARLADVQGLIAAISDALAPRGIVHVTVQAEPAGHAHGDSLLCSCLLGEDADEAAGV